jgi:hypothetical protein
MFFMRTDRVVVLAPEGRIGRTQAVWRWRMRAPNFYHRRDEKFATLDGKGVRGRVVKFAAAVYRATGQMADDQSPWA